MSASDKTWVNNNAPACEDDDLNGFNKENNNLIEGSGQSLNTSDNQQTHKAVSAYAAHGDFYSDTGGVNAYVLAAQGSKVAPPVYSDGMRIRFTTANINTGASTVNVGGLGVKDIKQAGGANPYSGQITGRVTLYYDSANGWFEVDNSNSIASRFIGTISEVNWADDPATLGLPALRLNGQGELVADYPALTARNYVGDANNAAAAAAGGGWYRADDAAGTTPNIAGIYLILPESRGFVPRGLDTAASIDPDGASRFIGDLQVDAMQRVTGNGGTGWPVTDTAQGDGVFSQAGAASANRLSPIVSPGVFVTFDSANSTSPNAAKTDDDETRMSNRSTYFIVWYA